MALWSRSNSSTESVLSDLKLFCFNYIRVSRVTPSIVVSSAGLPEVERLRELALTPGVENPLFDLPGRANGESYPGHYSSGSTRLM